MRPISFFVGFLSVASVTLGWAAPEDWAFRIPDRPNVPARSEEGKKWSSHPIDAFIWNRLEENGLRPAGPAPVRILLRRLSFNLHGLPPSQELLSNVAAELTGDRYAAVVDQLLASPQYGERWARHWLDVARYGESNGFEYNEPRPNAWPYRDWVISALNEDMPYDHFAREQMAGSPEAVGFLVAGLHRSSGGANDIPTAQERHDGLEEMVGTLSQAFLGVTAQCARCHDHPTDPIPSADYYRLAAALAGVHHDKAKSKAKVYTVISKPAGAMHVFPRGDTTQPGVEVTTGGLSALGEEAANFGLTAKASDLERRKKLAEWVTTSSSHLFARVMVNRVWHYHFGTGIVDTPSDLGNAGGEPSHPALLDWLAYRFRDNGYSLKALHRLILTSQTYRQSSRFSEKAAATDRNARLLWRFSPKRLEGEAVRDSLLVVAGVLNPKRGGAGFIDTEEKNFNAGRYYLPIDPEGPEFNRRTIYRFSPRGERSSLLDNFDCPDPSATAPRRYVTTTPLQALSLSNSPFVWRMADHFAERLEQEGGDELSTQVNLAWLLALGREPRVDEKTAAVELAKEHGLAALGRALFTSSEFILIE